MTQPAIIIGLGGTGQWVTTFIKKELMEENHGVLPAEVRLLCFDTFSSPANYDFANAPDVENNKIGLELHSELINLSCDLYDFGKQVWQELSISDDRLNSPYAWFNEDYL